MANSGMRRPDVKVELSVRNGRAAVEFYIAAFGAVEVFRANAIARHQGEVALRRTNLQFDAALNSMLQGMVVWGPDLRVQLVNGRFFTICRMPVGSIAPGMTLREVIEASLHHGRYQGEHPDDLVARYHTLLTARQSALSGWWGRVVPWV